jgi:hypothetical protein
MTKYLSGLGFKDMVQTRLRASYCLMKILSVEILRGLYFPSGDLMSAELGSRPSEIWRAMIEGHEVLKLCLIKVDRNGPGTSIWNDNWIPRST